MAGASITFSFLLLVLYVSSEPITTSLQSGDRGYVSAVVTEKGLDFVKDLLVEQAVRTLTPLQLNSMEKSVTIPVIGGVYVRLSNITFNRIEVSSSTIETGDSGVRIAASVAAANLSMDWYYSYRTWLAPIEISDRGRAFVQVDGMEVGLTLNLENQEGTLKLTMIDCDCYMEDLFITLEGGASWLYQGLVDAFGDPIRSAVETAVKKKITEGISRIDSFLQNIPTEIRVDDTVSLNVSVVDVLLGDSSIEFNIDGLFVARNELAVSNFLHKNSHSSLFCKGPLNMLGISLDEEVFNSASAIYFETGQLHWTVDKVPDRSLLNTAGWRYIIPQLYMMYPNDDMKLNISFTSPPTLTISKQNVNVLIFLDMVMDVLDATEAVSVACISMVVTASGVPEILGNNLAGSIALEDFTLNLKWSKIGNFHMDLIQGTMRVFLNKVFIPYVNLHLRKGFSLPIIQGFTTQNAKVLPRESRIVVCTDVTFPSSHDLIQHPA